MSAKIQEKIGEKEKLVEKCGVVMPMSAIDGLSADHWREVFSIVTDVIKDSGFEPTLVSNADEAGIIQMRSMQNIYSNPIIVFDVSAKNPKVMFELGLRLAFGKPTIIIKDDATNYNFDSSPIEPITYPRDLRFSSIVAFKEVLRNSIESTYKAYTENPEGIAYFRELGNFKNEKAGAKEETSEKYILDSIEQLIQEVKTIKNNINKDSDGDRNPLHSHIGANKFTDIFLRPDNLEIFVTSKMDQFIQNTGLRGRADIEKQRLQHKVFEFITSSNPELDNDVIERLILEVINRQIRTA